MGHRFDIGAFSDQHRRMGMAEVVRADSAEAGVGGVALSAASPEALWPTAFVAAAYILGQAIVDTWGE